jgi:hypothetical protein
LPQTATVVAQRPLALLRNITSFSESPRCVDSLFLLLLLNSKRHTIPLPVTSGACIRHWVGSHFNEDDAMNKIPSIFAVSLAVSMITTPPASWAVDTKIYPGNMCNPWLQGDIGIASAYEYWNGYSNKTLTVSCPIVRDNEANTNGTQSVYVRVENRAVSSVPLYCYLRSYDSLGNLVETSRTSNFNGPGKTSLFVDVNSSAVVGYYSLECYLPPYSGIMSYRVDEF